MARPLVWEQVNSVTWKLTDGRQIDTPRSHGQWPGFRTSLAVGWVMQVGDDWVGRATIRGKRMSSGPATFDAAKRWVKNRVTGVPIAKPLPQSAYQMAFDGWSILFPTPHIMPKVALDSRSTSFRTMAWDNPKASVNDNTELAGRTEKAA